MTDMETTIKKMTDNNDNDHDHERARQMLSLGGDSELSGAERAWLESHMEACESCRAFAQDAGDVVRALRAIPVAADRSLVATTQMRVRLRARELRQREERMWLVGVSCVAVTLTAAFTNLACWRGFAWLVERTHISAATWPVAFVALWIAPALAASVLLLALGTHLADHNRRTQGFDNPQD
ncbi:MAG: zf-HC2 domain-containing protein [Terriglobales bacterium]